MEQDEVIIRLKEIDNLVNSLLDQLQPKTQIAEVPASTRRPIRWGAKVTSSFRESVLWIEEKLGLNADFLMACMAFETGGTFSPSVKNAAGSSGTGLIQFMRPTAINLGTTVEEMAKMTPERQLGFVYKYFKAFGNDLSHWVLEDIYMAILYPRAIGKPLDWSMPWTYGSIAFKQNSGLDLNKDHKITKAEAAHGVRRLYELGAQFMG